MTNTPDTLQKFVFEDAAVRGELVDISATWREIVARHHYPVAVKRLLGQMVSAAALLSANLKFNGSLIMQLHGDGPVRLLVVECDSDLRMRATAKMNAEFAIAEDAGLQALVNAQGHGRFVITLDPAEKVPGQQPYQGIVPLDGDDVATVIEHYMLRSEQLDTKLWLHGGKAEATAHAAEVSQETWNRVVMLGDTLKEAEMLEHGIDVLQKRLFWEETLRVFEPLHPQFHCSCTREKVGNMLKMLGQQEVEEALSEQGKLGINCDFCGKHYEYDAVDCAQLFVTDAPAEALIHGSEAKH
jgi:molecular chaperone Hsp33